MTHPADTEAARLTQETGIYHYADFNDLTHQMEVINTGCHSEEEFYNSLLRDAQRRDAKATGEAQFTTEE